MSLALEYKIEGLQELLADARAIGAQGADKLIMAALRNSASRTQSEQRKRAPHRTGTLQRSILVDIDYPSAEISVQEKYGIWIEEGTGIYGPTGQPIRPRSKKALAFKIGGVPVVVKSVKGKRAKPFFKPGYEAAKPYIDSQFDTVGDKLEQALAGKRV